jgi:5-methylcytosine-specific restriction endonuclease McrA
MIPVQRGLEPASLPPVREAKLAKLRALDGKFKPDDFKGYDIVKSELWIAQHYKCCFCEQKIARSYNAVEHYRPKAGADRRPGCPENHGYWWLAFTWENLLLACPICNSSAKGIRFPLEVGSTALQAEQAPPEGEQALLLDPTGNVNPVAHIVFENEAKGGSGTPAYWWAKPRNGSRLGQYTIDVCKFNHPEFLELRNDHFEQVILKHVQPLKDALAKRKVKLAKAEFERALARLQPPNAYVALNYDAFRQCIPDETLQAVIKKSWPQPDAVGR